MDSFTNQFDYIGKLSEGLIRFKIGIHPKCRCGFIDVTGKIVIPPVFTNVRDFHNGIARVKVGNWATGKWCFINKSGEIIISCLYNEPRKFSDGYSKVILNGEWCFIDITGEKVISLNEYDGGTSFHDGYANVCKRNDNMEEVYGIIDKTGKEIIPCLNKTSFDCSKLPYWVDKFLSGKGVY